MTQVFLTSAAVSPWSRPGDWTDNGHTVNEVGAGGQGGTGAGQTQATGGGGGGGGGHQLLTWAGGTGLQATTPFAIAAQNTTAGNQTASSTYWEDTTNGNAYQAQCGDVGAAGGGNTAAAGGAAGSHFTNGTPTVTYNLSQGNNGAAGGATVASTLFNGGGGGGGAGGPTGVGKAGGGPTGTAAIRGGGGGGGSNGGTSTAGANSTSSSGGNGGNGTGGSGGGTGSTVDGTAGGNATANSGGGGGGGFGSGTASTTNIGGNGVGDQAFDGTHGAGGGGGGGGSNSVNTSGATSSGGNGGNYGAGGGGSGGCRNGTSTRTAGTGGGGLIVITYTPAVRVFLSDQPVPTRLLVQRNDLTTVFVSVPSVPTTARGDFEQPRLVKMLRNDPNLAQPHRVPDPAPVAWKPWQDYNQPKLLKILPPLEILLRQFPQATGFVAPVFPSDQPVPVRIKVLDNSPFVFLFQQLFSVLPSDVPVPIRIRAQSDVFATSQPITAAATPAGWFNYDQQSLIKTRPSGDIVTASQPFTAAQLLIPQPSEQPIPIKARLQSDNFASVPQPTAAAAAPTMAWQGFDQSITIKIRPQFDNIAFPSQVPALAPPIMPSVHDESYTTDIFIYDAVVTPVQPFAAVVTPNMPWQFDQPLPIKVRPQFDISQRPFVAPPILGPLPSDQPIPIRARFQGEFVGIPQPFAAAQLLVPQPSDAPVPIKIRLQDNWPAVPQPFAAAQLLVPQPSDQPVPIKVRAQFDTATTQFPRATGFVSTVYPFGEMVPIRIQPFPTNLVQAPQPFAAAQLLVPQPSDQPVVVKARFAGDIVYPAQSFVTAVPSMAWLFDQPVPIKTRVLDNYPLMRSFAAPSILTPQPSDQPFPVRARFAGEITYPAQPFAAPASIGWWQQSDIQPVVRIKPPDQTVFSPIIVVTPPPPPAGGGVGETILTFVGALNDPNSWHAHQFTRKKYDEFMALIAAEKAAIAAIEAQEEPQRRAVLSAMAEGAFGILQIVGQEAPTVQLKRLRKSLTAAATTRSTERLMEEWRRAELAMYAIRKAMEEADEEDVELLLQ